MRRWVEHRDYQIFRTLAILNCGKDIALSMYMSAYKTLQGSKSNSKTEPDFTNAKVKMFHKPKLAVEMIISVCLPDLTTRERHTRERAATNSLVLARKVACYSLVLALFERFLTLSILFKNHLQTNFRELGFRVV